MSRSAEQWLTTELAELDRQGMRRSLRVLPAVGGHIRDEAGHDWLNFSSNDYLDLARHPLVCARAQDAIRRYGVGATASRLVSGTLPLHEELESRLATHKGYPAALVAGAGYIANCALVPALVGRDDLIVADKLVHASLIDAAMQSRATLLRFRHNDPVHLRQILAKRPATARTLVLVESVYSMDGDVAPLSEIAAACNEAKVLLLVDEAHSAGVFGHAGCGLVRELGLTGAVNIAMSTLSKAFGGYGGVLACSTPMRDWLINRHRGFIYSTALPPAVIGAALGALEVMEQEPERGQRLLDLACGFRTQLQAAGFDTGDSASQIIPILLGDNDRALSAAAKLREHGILAAAIRPPTVPVGTARLRLSITLAHTPDDLARTADTITRLLRDTP